MNNSAFQSYFTTQMLHNYTKKLYSHQNRREEEAVAEVKELEFQCHVEEEKYDYLAGLELEEHILYAFAKNKELGCEISVYTFRKCDGIKNFIAFKDMTGSVTCMTIMLVSQAHKSQKTEYRSTYRLIIGFSDGFVKMINLADSTKLTGRRMDVKPIVSIIKGRFDKFYNQNICIVLAQDFYIFFLDVITLQIAFVLKPTLIMCDQALSIETNAEYSFLLQASKGGYLVFWRLADVLSHFKKRSFEGMQHSKEFNVFPARVNHTIAVQGLIWCAFYGHLIAVITKTGILKLIAINVKAQDQFIFLLQYQISHHQSISCTYIYPLHNTIFLSKIRDKQCVIERLSISDYLTISNTLIISLPQVGRIYDFYLPSNSEILMCRGQRSFGIGFFQNLFEKVQGSTDYEVQKIY